MMNNLDEFKDGCSTIIVNKYDSCLNDVKTKGYTYDIFLLIVKMEE